MQTRKEINAKYYKQNAEELRKKRREKYHQNKIKCILKINNQYYCGYLSKGKYKLNDNFTQAIVFNSTNAIQNVLKKYNLKEEEVQIINV